MTDQPQTSLDLFIATVERIKDIRGSVRAVRELPSRVAHDVDRVQITVERGYSYNEKLPAAACDAARRIKAQMEAEFRADAEHARDAKLSALAAEMESIRAVLPSLAARAAIDIGHAARLLKHEADGGAL
jgi:hypothetical protein